MGLVELETDKYPLKVGQNLLELLSLSTASTFKKAVVLLATDCNKKWELFFFSDGRTITSKVYDHGSKTWDDFFQLLNTMIRYISWNNGSKLEQGRISQWTQWRRRG